MFLPYGGQTATIFVFKDRASYKEAGSDVPYCSCMQVTNKDLV